MKRGIAVAALLLAFCSGAFGQKIKQMEFRNQSVSDILLVLAQLSGKSIVVDETVTGTTSFFFAETDFETALSSFLTANNLYYKKAGDIYYVSRIKVDFDRASGLVSLDAEDVDAQLVLRALSRAIERTILFDSLPKMNVSIHAVRLKPEAVIELAIKRFADFKLVIEKDYFYVRKTESVAGTSAGGAAASNAGVRASGDSYSIDLVKGKLLDVLLDLFAKRGAEYSFLMRTDVIVENLHFKDRPFDELLRLVLEQANADFAVYSGVYYLFEIQRRDVIKKLKQNVVVPLIYLSVQDFAAILPPELASSSLIKTDKASNSVLLTGSPAEIGPIVDFIALIDRPAGGRVAVRYEAKYMKAKDLVATLPSRFVGYPPVVSADGIGVVFFVAAGTEDELLLFLSMVDRKVEAVPVRLRYIKAEELFKNLPPSVTKEDVVDSGQPDLVFFVGSRDKLSRFLADLAQIDRPKPLIEYDILVVKNSRSPEEGFGVTYQADQATVGQPRDGSMAITGSFTELLSIKLDVFTALGEVLGMKLELTLKNKESQLYAETRLVGLSGQDVKFKNTEIVRRPTPTYDAETGKTIPGVIREFESGLTISINGWISGDGMITITVSVDVSKKNDAATNSETTLPETSVSSASTQLRVESGQPIVITGFVIREEDVSTTKVPILGDIPILGLLFTQEKRSVKETELTVYIIPRVVLPEGTEATAGLEMERMYLRYASETR
jgi:type II secretory pathway component GspD/PulD (secretin)